MIPGVLVADCCDFGYLGVQQWSVWAASQFGCEITFQSYTKCSDASGTPQNAQMTIWSEVDDVVLYPWAIDVESGLCDRLDSTIDTTGGLNHCYVGNANAEWDDPDSGAVCYTNSISTMESCCEILWAGNLKKALRPRMLEMAFQRYESQKGAKQALRILLTK